MEQDFGLSKCFKNCIIFTWEYIYSLVNLCLQDVGFIIAITFFVAKLSFSAFHFRHFEIAIKLFKTLVCSSKL